MAGNPLETLRRRPVEAKRDDESVGDYIRRLGDEYALQPARVEGAAEYVEQWYFAPAAPDAAPWQRFLAGLPTPEAPAPEAEARDADATHDPETVARHRSVAPDTETLGFKGGLRGRAGRRLLLRFAIVLLTTPAIGWLLGRVWRPGVPIYETAADLLVSATGLPTVPALELAGSVGLGLYVALLALFVIDVRKRVQGSLLLLGSVLALAVVTRMGVFLPNIELTTLNAAGVLVGLVVGLAIEADRLSAIDATESTLRRPATTAGEPAEFRRAATVLFAVVAVLIIASTGQALAAGTATLADPVAAGAFLLMFLQFVRYEADARYLTLGPARSGKSMLLLGLVLTLLDSADMPPRPNDYLRQGLERASNLRAGAARWPLPSTAPDQLQTATFEVIAGTFFPRRLELTALDYAGQHLAAIAEQFADGGPPDEPDSIPDRVAATIAETDTLLVVLDVERFLFPDVFQDAVATPENVSWGFDQYSTIIEGAPVDDVVLVATKCDLLIDQGEVQPPYEYDGFDAYRRAVTQALAGRPDVAELLELTGEDALHPVYFLTRYEHEEYVPQLDADGALVPVGYDFLLDELKRRQ
jgi:hypothetical protein